MDAPVLLEPQCFARNIYQLGAYVPVPGIGVLAVNSYLIRGLQPVLVDTGIAALREPFMDQLRALIDPAELRWIWLTHADPDHAGNLAAVLAEAPQARVVTNFLGMGKLGLLQLPVDRVYLLNHGQALDVGDRELLALAPPSFDAPETSAAFDRSSGVFFCADSFGALLAEPAATAQAIDPAALREGLIAWSALDCPWLRNTDERRLAAALAAVRELDATVIAGSHLPPAQGLTDALLQHLAAARTAPAFVGPDQAALERMMAATAA
jgi:flavorubredoxin